ELARRAAVAIDNAMLYEAEQRARARAEEAAGRAAVLQSVTASLSEAPTPAEVAEVIVERGLAALGASAASIALRRDSDIEVLRSIGYRDEQVEPWRTFPVDAAVPLADAIRTGNPVFLRSGEERDARYPNLSTSWPTGDRAWAAIPLTVQGSTLGAMGLSFRDVREFDEGDRG